MAEEKLNGLKSFPEWAFPLFFHKCNRASSIPRSYILKGINIFFKIAFSYHFT